MTQIQSYIFVQLNDCPLCKELALNVFKTHYILSTSGNEILGVINIEINYVWIEMLYTK